MRIVAYTYSFRYTSTAVIGFHPAWPTAHVSSSFCKNTHQYNQYINFLVLSVLFNSPVLLYDKCTTEVDQREIFL